VVGLFEIETFFTKYRLYLFIEDRVITLNVSSYLYDGLLLSHFNFKIVGGISLLNFFDKIVN